MTSQLESILISMPAIRPTLQAFFILAPFLFYQLFSLLKSNNSSKRTEVAPGSQIFSRIELRSTCQQSYELVPHPCGHFQPEIGEKTSGSAFRALSGRMFY